jgi:hypothetical protein
MAAPRERHCLYRLGAFVAARGRRPSIRLFGSGIAPRPERDDLTPGAWSSSARIAAFFWARTQWSAV